MNYLKIKLHIIALNEINSRFISDNIHSCYINELSIPGYNMYHNIECKEEHGVVICVNKDLHCVSKKRLNFKTV